MAGSAATLDAPSRRAPARPGLGSGLKNLAGNIFPFVVVGAIWEGFAHSGLFPPRLFPPLEQVASAFVKLTVAGILPHHAILTLLRLLAGFGIAAVVGVTIGLAMARSR